MEKPAEDEVGPFSAETASRRDALREKVDAAAERLAARRSIARAVGTDDQSIVDRLEQLGFNGESAQVIDLLPLVHVAWSDGRVQRGERAKILSILESRGLAPTSEASLLIETLLERRPSETFMAESLALVRELAEKSGRDPSELVDLCVSVADASGRLFGLGGAVSAAERTLIEQIATALGEAAQERFRSRFRG
jgi:uncharacterized tellurite resistance protein B-like protein